MILHFGLVPSNYRSKALFEPYFPRKTIPPLPTPDTAKLHLMLRSLCLHLLLFLCCPFYNMTQIAYRQLDRKIDRRERQREQYPPSSSTSHEPKRPSRNQTLPRNSRITFCGLPECSSEQAEDDGESPFYNSEADVGAETADGKHER